jgi:hypothetical protein
MKSTFLLAAVVAATFAAPAFAVEGGTLNSEYLHQTDSGLVEITPGFGNAPGDSILLQGLPGGFQMYNFSGKNGGSGGSGSLIPLNVAAEWGISGMWSVGAQVAYGWMSTSKDNCSGTGCKPTGTGLYDPNIYVKGRNDLGAGVLQYGLVANISVDKNKTDGNDNTNLSSGGSGITPFVSWQMNAGPGIWGARFNYQLWRDNRKTTADFPTVGSNASVKGGNSWTLDTFYEVPYGMVTYGGAIFYRSAPDSLTTTDSGGTISSQDGYTQWGAQFYVPVHFASATLLPNLAYTSLKNSASAVASDTISTWQLGVAARVTF